MRENQKSSNKFDFFFTFEKDKISKKERLWNWSPILFLIHIIILQSMLNTTVIGRDNQTSHKLLYENETQIELTIDSESVKNTTFISQD